MSTLLFATNNEHKLTEMRSAVGDLVQLISLREAGLNIDIPEPYDTLEANATEKSTVIFGLTGLSCFSEDTGLEVYSINNEPGVRSARYAGDHCSPEDNIILLLDKLRGKTDRRAQFRTVISLIWKGREHQFQGICEGSIVEHKRGSQGFGYDPVFVPAGTTQTFAEMGIEQKNSFSHRKKAADQLVLFLQQNQGQPS